MYQWPVNMYEHTWRGGKGVSFVPLLVQLITCLGLVNHVSIILKVISFVSDFTQQIIEYAQITKYVRRRTVDINKTNGNIVSRIEMQQHQLGVDSGPETASSDVGDGTSPSTAS